MHSCHFNASLETPTIALENFLNAFQNIGNVSERNRNTLKIGPTHLQNIFQTLTMHLNSERTSHFLYQPRETTVLHTVHAKILFTFWWLQKLCRFASRRVLKCFTSNVQVIIIIPATASAATAIINFKMKALHSMTCRVPSWRKNLENNIKCIGSNGFPIIYRTKFGR